MALSLISTASNFTIAGTDRSVAGVSWQAGDLIVVKGHVEDNSVIFSTEASNANLTFTPVTGFPSTTASHTKEYAWTATAGSTQSAQTIAAALIVGSKFAGITVEVWRGHNGIGAILAPTASSGTTISGSLTTTGANSALTCGAGDWAAVAATGATLGTGPGTPTSEIAQTGSGRASAYDWYSANVGAAGSKTVAVTNTAAQTGLIWGFEILAASGSQGGPASATMRFQPAVTGKKSAQATYSGQVRFQPAVTGAKTGKASGSALTRFITAATGGQLHQSASSALLRFATVVGGRKDAKDSHDESSVVPPFTQTLPGSRADVHFSTAATGVQGVHAGPASATLRFVTTVAGRKGAVAAASSSMRFQPAVTGLKRAASAASALVHLVTSAVGGAGSGVAANRTHGPTHLTIDSDPTTTLGVSYASDVAVSYATSVVIDSRADALTITSDPTTTLALDDA